MSPAVSEKQRKAAGVALAAKRGERDPESLRGASRDMYSSMSEKELSKLAEKSEK